MRTIPPKASAPQVDTLTVARRRQMLLNESVAAARSAIASALGYGYGGDRDIYKALGYRTTLSFADYMAAFLRSPIGGRVVEAVVEETWREVPFVISTQKQQDPSVDTPFDKAWTELDRLRRLSHYMGRVDLLSGIGRYGVLFLGFSDGVNQDALKTETKRESKLLYLFPATEDTAKIDKWNNDSASERYGLPEIYSIKVERGDGNSQTFYVHHSRVLHVAEGLTENEVYGTPRLERVFNNVADLYKVGGGSAEMFWRGAMPGMQFDISSEANPSTQDLDALKEQVENYVHNLTRYVRTKGMAVNMLAPSIADPQGHFSVIIDMIAAGARIPKRILMGSERGELASSQDEKAWMKRVQTRQVQYVSPCIVRALVDRLIKVGALPDPGEKGYEVEWPPLYDVTESEKATTAKTKTDMAVAYGSAGAAVEAVLPKRLFREKFLGMTPDEIDEAEKEDDRLEAEAEAEAEEIARQEKEAAEAAGTLPGTKETGQGATQPPAGGKGKGSSKRG